MSISLILPCAREIWGSRSYCVYIDRCKCADASSCTSTIISTRCLNLYYIAWNGASERILASHLTKIQLNAMRQRLKARPYKLCARGRITLGQPIILINHFEIHIMMCWKTKVNDETRSSKTNARQLYIGDIFTDLLKSLFFLHAYIVYIRGE